MPEIPEIKAHAMRLDRRLGGDSLTHFDVLSFTALKTTSPEPAEAVGCALDGVSSRGKYLLLRFGEITFCVHLMQGGRLEPDTSKAARPRGGLARWTLTANGSFLLREAGKEHKAGVWVMRGDAPSQEPLAHLGPEADSIGEAELRARLRADSMRLHGFLRDQRRLAGLGRRLANEVCHRARLSPFASTGRLDDESVTRLHRAIKECVEEGLAFEIGRDSMSSSRDRPGRVHHHAGETCPVCGDTVRAVEYSSYTVNYCATCQTGGKVLADNTTSRFLR